MVFFTRRTRRLLRSTYQPNSYKFYSTQAMFFLVVFIYVLAAFLVIQFTEFRLYGKSNPEFLWKNQPAEFLKVLREGGQNVPLSDCCNTTSRVNGSGFSEKDTHVKGHDGSPPACCNNTKESNRSGSFAEQTTTNFNVVRLNVSSLLLGCCSTTTHTGARDSIVVRNVTSKMKVNHTEQGVQQHQTFSNEPPWRQFVEGVSLDALYPRSASFMTGLLHHMNSAKIVNASIFKGGTQIKFLLRFEDGNLAISKPMRHGRDVYWAYNMTEPFWFDEERHTAEIASFHLDRILDFRKVIPCVGRKVDFFSEIINNTNDRGILDTLKKTDDGKNCFIGNCVNWMCNDDHQICDNDDVMELSVCLRLPGKIYSAIHPWSQGLKEAKVWKNRNVCEDAHQTLDKIGLRGNRFFLDMMEVALFDHLIINYDRHHYDRADVADLKSGFALINDNGKGFGNPFKDDITFLAPIYQCCRFRNSTYQHILTLSGRLGDLMRESLAKDPLAPILTEPFFTAMDRRLNQFYDVMKTCLETHGHKVVLTETFDEPKRSL